jgi:hypothetical protein
MRYQDAGFETLVPVVETDADATMVRSTISAVVSRWRMEMRDASGNPYAAKLGPLGVRRGHVNDADGWCYSAELRQDYPVDPAHPGRPPRYNDFAGDSRHLADIRLVLIGGSDQRETAVEIRLTSIDGRTETRYLRADGSERGYPAPTSIGSLFELAADSKARVDAEHKAAHEWGRAAGLFAD